MVGVAMALEQGLEEMVLELTGCQCEMMIELS